MSYLELLQSEDFVYQQVYVLFSLVYMYLFSVRFPLVNNLSFSTSHFAARNILQLLEVMPRQLCRVNFFVSPWGKMCEHTNTHMRTLSGTAGGLASASLSCFRTDFLWSILNAILFIGNLMMKQYFSLSVCNL